MEDTLYNSVVITKTYKVLGMTCASCALSIESYLRETDGIKSVNVNYPNQSTTVAFDPSEITLSAISKSIADLGYTLVTEDTEDKEGGVIQSFEKQRLKILRLKLLFSIVFSLPVFVISMFFMGMIPYENWILLVLSSPVLFWTGSEFFVVAWKRLKHFSSNMDTLVALSTGVAFGFSVFNTVYPQYFISRGLTPHVYYESAVVIITLILLGRFLEERAKGKTSSAIQRLIGLNPKEVCVIRNGVEEIIPSSEVQKGELIVLKPGDKVPVDGKVKKGDSYVDESMINGEPIPLHKQKGDFVYAGTINQRGNLRIFAEKVGDETLLSQIIALVEKAQSTKPKVQQLVDKIAAVFVPLVMVLALITFGVWLYWGPSPSFSYAITSLITVLIIACPCALGLATPTALMVGIGKGAEVGILIKDAKALETIYKTDVLVVDKTGTLTEGKPKVQSILWNEGVDAKLYARILMSIEKASEHPLAESIVNYLKSSGTEDISVDRFESITGMGTSAFVENNQYYVGNEALMHQHQLTFSNEILQSVESMKKKAYTLVYVGSGKEVHGVIGITDQLKASSKKAIEDLQRSGVEVHILTGDNENSAKAIAEQLNISQFKSDVRPEEKAEYIKELQDNGKIVAMAGDGINDSGALALADVGIAMGTGTDIAMESAEITLMNANLELIPQSILLSKETMKTIRQNLFWAFIYNIVSIPIAAGALYPAFRFLLNPMIAGGAMSMSSISVLLNSLRLKNKQL